ncbi:Phospholipase/carboxyhydrolase [Phaffia rhodozyma]|uniref:Phospholipase/carboxyhydrolase n=1 Tax=Phaffia rhodozyma TaxID=264483 RepID=A0A0F7SUK0_PHARH|nr:Phospholipase/carboxyhydrolase [Phaffia rhodozyma]
MRILTLPGYTQNAIILSKRMGALRKTCGKNIEFVFVDPPHIVLNPSFGGTLADFDSSATTSKGEMTPETTPRSWWEVEPDKKENFVGYDEAVRYLRDFIEKDEKGFDGVMGFSQGAGMAALLCSLINKPSVHPLFSTSKINPFKFAIFVGGFVPNAKNLGLEKYFPIDGNTATLHIIGKVDVIISEARSLALADNCEDSRVEYHDGGHFVPSKASYRNFFRDYISSFEEGGSQGDVPSPVSATPTPVSGRSAAGSPEPTPAPKR